MDSNTGDIYRIDIDGAEEDLQRELQAISKNYEGRRQIPLTEKQYNKLEPMTNKNRKGWMRNQPCVCGSGKKFKKCCWYKYGN